MTASLSNVQAIRTDRMQHELQLVGLQRLQTESRSAALVRMELAGVERARRLQQEHTTESP